MLAKAPSRQKSVRKAVNFFYSFVSLRLSAKKINVKVHLGGLEISEITLRLCVFARKIINRAKTPSRILRGGQVTKSFFPFSPSHSIR